MGVGMKPAKPRHMGMEAIQNTWRHRASLCAGCGDAFRRQEKGRISNSKFFTVTLLSVGGGRRPNAAGGTTRFCHACAAGYKIVPISPIATTGSVDKHQGTKATGGSCTVRVGIPLSV